MLRNAKDFLGFGIEATDGALGHVMDVYFDDDAWVVRYLVVETGSWLSHRRVLVSPYSMDEPKWISETFPVRLTREQVRKSPGVDTDKPVSRQYELSLGGYYAYPNYWGSTGMWGAGYYPWTMYRGVSPDGTAADHAAVQGRRTEVAQDPVPQSDDDPHLRSYNAVIGYHIHAEDGDIGHIAGLLVDEKSWAIRYLVIDTSNWWLGHQVLIAPEWITEVSWADRKVMIDLSRLAIRDAPHWDPALVPDRSQEVVVHEHYGRTGYWDHVPPGPIRAHKSADGAPRHPLQPVALHD